MVNKDDSYIENKHLANEMYETAYGIFNFYQPNTGLKCVAVHPKEEYYRDTFFDKRMREFLELRIHKHTGLDFHTYMSYPRYYIEHINRLVREFSIIEYRIQKKAEARAEEQQRKDDARREKQKGNKEDFSYY